MLKTFIRFFTIADYEDEELWLRYKHREGWKLVSMTPPCFYHFESCEPEDVIYRMDFKNNTQTPEYMQMISDFGWEYVNESLGWLYFRKPSSEAESEEDGELFSDDESRVDLVIQVAKKRLWPLVIVFLCCVMPGLLNTMNGLYSGFYEKFFTIFFGTMFVIYVFLIVYCGFKLRNIKSRYTNK